MGDSSLILFILATFVILSFYGGGFATIPAYLKDIFGSMQVGAIHGRLLTAWSAAGIAGALIINTVLENRREAGASGLGMYQLSLFIMVGVLAVGFIANALMRPVDSKYHATGEEVAELSAPIQAADSSGVMLETRANENGTLHRMAAAVLTGIVVVGLAYGLFKTIVKSLALFN